jgi:HAD superfamily hydrolase (TIGR01493 family)
VAVFDLGKVLVDFDYGIAAGRLAARSNLDAAAVRRLIDQSPLLLRYETGLMTREEFFAEVRQASGFGGTLEEFSGFFADVFTAIPSMIELQAALRRSGVPTYIFSNTNDLAVAHIRRHFPFFATFDAHVLSYEHRSMKPEPRIYEVVEAVTGCREGAILYIDDRLENIETGRARGWETIHHLDPVATIARVRELGLPTPESGDRIP